MNKHHLLLVCTSMLIALLGACQGTPALQPPSGSSGSQVPLYPNAQQLTLNEPDRSTFIKEVFGSQYLLYNSNTNVSWVKDTGAKVRKQLDDLLPNANWRIQSDWSARGQFNVSIWRKGDLQVLLAYLDNLDSNQVNDLKRQYGISVPETGSTLIVTHLWDTTQPLPTATPTNTPTRSPTATPTKPPTPSPDILTRFKSGIYRVELEASAGRPITRTTWTLEISGSQITGKSEWDCCPGHRVDAMKGRIEGNHIIIERDCSGQGFTGECRQVYEGTITGDVIRGSWTGTGATASEFWTLYLNQ